jgi:hypothetical protein
MKEAWIKYFLSLKIKEIFLLHHFPSDNQNISSSQDSLGGIQMGYRQDGCGMILDHSPISPENITVIEIQYTKYKLK